MASISDLSNKIAEWRQHPAQMVRDLFHVKPDTWQDEALEAFPHSPRMAMKSCAGAGKSSLLSWCSWNFLLTRPHPILGATSITGDNLKANLWTELARWHNASDLLRHLFDVTKTEITSKEHPKTWRLEARTWARDADDQSIGNALRGLHAKYVMWVLDETGDYPNSIMPVCENIFSGDPVEAHIIQAGNPTRLDGPLYRAAVLSRDLWRVIEITADPEAPNRTTRVSVEHAREQIKQYGRDNPWVMINILGQFPPSSLNALIGPDEVRAAMGRYYREYEIGAAPRIMGVDVAREGDDSSILFKRQGIQAFKPRRFRNIDSTQGAGVTAREWEDWQADAVFVDATGGFGSGWIDQLRNLGRAPIGVHFSGESQDKARYFNKRTEMYFNAVEWVKRGGALPDEPELLATLTQTTYGFKGDKLLLEPKDIIKKKLGYSPDIGDAFALTFAFPVAAATRRSAPKPIRADYDPFADAHKVGLPERGIYR